MKNSTLKKLLFLLLSLISSIALSENIESINKKHSQTNAMAAQIMSWYGSLLPEQNNIVFNEVESRLKEYRKHYPESINHLKIINSQLDDSMPDQSAIFNLTLNISSSLESDENITQLQEQFVFKEKQDGTMVISKLVLQEEKLLSIDTISQTTKRIFYKSREVAYTWLAFLDGNGSDRKLLKSTLDSTYHIQIGSKDIRGSIGEALEQRRVYLDSGLHTLRSIEISHPSQGQSTYILDLIMDWNGFNAKGLPVIAKIKQRIKVKLIKNGVFEIISIDEKHLIPDLTPWQDLLC